MSAQQSPTLTPPPPQQDESSDQSSLPLRSSQSVLIQTYDERSRNEDLPQRAFLPPANSHEDTLSYSDDGSVDSLESITSEESGALDSTGTYSNSKDDVNTPFQLSSSARLRLSDTQGPIHLQSPKKNLVTNKGYILVRIERRRFGFLRKTFVKQFWIKYGTHSLLFFDSKSKYNRWISEKNLSREEREALVSDCIDFENDCRLKNILGYKSTFQYPKRYRGHGQLHLFKLYKWRSHGVLATGSLTSRCVGGYASKNAAEVKNLLDLVMGMIRSSSSNVRLQHHILSSSLSPVTFDSAYRIEHFHELVYHDEFTDWILQTKLDESGFIVSRMKYADTYDTTFPSTDFY